MQHSVIICIEKKIEINTKAKNFVLSIHIYVIQNCQRLTIIEKKLALNCKQELCNANLFFIPTTKSLLLNSQKLARDGVKGFLRQTTTNKSYRSCNNYDSRPKEELWILQQ